jgi:hypothetical protein
MVVSAEGDGAAFLATSFFSGAGTVVFATEAFFAGLVAVGAMITGATGGGAF